MTQTHTKCSASLALALATKSATEWLELETRRALQCGRAAGRAVLSEGAGKMVPGRKKALHGPPLRSPYPHHTAQADARAHLSHAPETNPTCSHMRGASYEHCRGHSTDRVLTQHELAAWSQPARSWLSPLLHRVTALPPSTSQSFSEGKPMGY